MKNPYIITEIEKKSATATAWTGVIFVTLTIIGMFWYGISHASTYGGNFLTGGTATASNVYSGQVASQAVDGNNATPWIPHNNNVNTFPEWWKYDLGSGVTKKLNKIDFLNYYNRLADADVQGSNDDSSWTNLGKINTAYSDNSTWETFYYATNTIAYRYYRIYINSGYASPDLYGTNIAEIKAYECLDCTSPTAPNQPTQTDQFNSYLSFLLDIILIAGIALIIIWVFK